jgi:hypothetical protein
VGAVDAAAAAAATAHSVSRRETCTSRAASLGPPLVCAARPRISATRGPWRGHGAAMRDIYGRQQHASGIPLDAARSGDARRYATSHAMERPWTDRGRAGPRTPLDPGTRRARPVPGRPRPGPDGLGGRGTAGRQEFASGDAGPRSGKMCFGTLNSDASCTRRLVNLDPWLARRTSRAAGLDHVRLATCDNTEHAARAPPPGQIGNRVSRGE